MKDSVINWTNYLVKAHPADAKAYAMQGDFLFMQVNYKKHQKVITTRLKLEVIFMMFG